MPPLVTIVVSTYNRAQMLGRTIRSLLAQQTSVPHEIIIVDNNCTDGTAPMVRELAAGHPALRYVFEQRQGLSYGRNAGIAAAGSDLIAFTDDDVVADPSWVEQIYNVSQAHPECGCFGGRVLPLWPSEPPGWLTEMHWSPLALVDYGSSQRIDSQNRKCLIGANMIMRRSVFDQVGYFSPAFQRVKEGVGTTEDQELQDRYWKAGGAGWFDPSIVVHADIQPERLTKTYHRRWHFAHGGMFALMRDPIMESSSLRILGVPGHVFRQLGSHIVSTTGALLRGRTDSAFLHEIQARFCLGYISRRWGLQG